MLAFMIAKVLQAGWEEQNIRKVIPKLNARSKGRLYEYNFKSPYTKQ